MSNRTRNILLFIILPAIFVGAAITDLMIGTVRIPVLQILSALFNKSDDNYQFTTIIWELRIPKTITTILAGAALSVAGLQMQTTFRNPLAGPYVLGISSGAGLGVALMMFGLEFLGLSNDWLVRDWSLIVAAWLGAAFVLFLILLVSSRIHDIMTILVLGMLFGAAASAIIGLMQYFGSAATLKTYILWTMGSVGATTNSQLTILLPSVAFGLLIAFLSTKMLNILLLGDIYAQSSGLNIFVARIVIFSSASILTGSITAFCGPIGFIGIVAPHLSRMIFKTANHFYLIPACILIGAIILLMGDILTLLPGNGIILPINSITALIGIPMVVWIVVRNRKIQI